MMNKEFLQLAIDTALDNIKSNNGGPFGAVIVKDGVLIAKSPNTVTSSNDPTAHAEINAIRLACKELKTFDLSGCEIYSSCEPCPMCLSAIYWARISKVYYAADRFDAKKAGFDDSFIYNEISLSEKERSIYMENAMHKEGQLPFELWQETENKTKY
ncbi:MAG: nucleoside deaminase [Bacteroidaceae bacterium]|nr:nucleoside deaminase [Bacteroidaceae bacterium]MEA5098972.1 nucleoside deaminase [Bacteroidales bacterium]